MTLITFLIGGLAVIGTITSILGMEPIGNVKMTMAGAFTLTAAGIGWFVLCTATILSVVNDWLRRKCK